MILKQWETKPPPGVGLDTSKSRDIPVYYAFNEAGGGIAYDLSGNRNPAVLNGPTWGAGKDGPAVHSTGTNEYIQIEDSPSLDSATGSGQPRTWSYWINITVAVDNKLITDKSGFAGKHFWSELHVSAGDVFIRGGVAVGGAVDTSVFSINTWQYILFTFDGTNTTLYRNGIREDGPQAQTAPADDNNALLLLARGDGAFAAPAILSQFIVRNGWLNAAEVARLSLNPWHEIEPIRIPLDVAVAAVEFVPLVIVI